MHIPKIMTQSRVQHQHVEEVVEVPVPMQQEEVVHVPKIITQTRVQQQQVVEEVEIPVPMQDTCRNDVGVPGSGVGTTKHGEAPAVPCGSMIGCR